MASCTPLTALLLDTGTTVYNQLAAPLGRAGVALLRATSPVDAVLMAHTEGPDVVVINLTLPRRLGDLAFSLLRASTRTGPIPIVFLIDHLRWGRRANDAAADALVAAPWAAERVLAAVRRVSPNARGTGGPAIGQKERRGHGGAR